MEKFIILDLFEEDVIFEELLEDYQKTNHKEFTLVRNNDDLYNFIDQEGNLILPFWYASYGDYFNGLFAVQNENGKWNFLNSNLELISKEWFDSYNEPDTADENDFYEVQNSEGKVNLLRKDGTLISNIWLDEIDQYWSSGYNYSIVILNDQYGFMDIHGHIKGWYEEFKCPYEETNCYVESDFIIVKKNNLYNLLNEKRQEISAVWYKGFPTIEHMSHPCCIEVELENGKFNFINSHGKILFPCDFDETDYHSLDYGFSVRKGSKWNLIFFNPFDKNHIEAKLLFNQWFDFVSPFIDTKSSALDYMIPGLHDFKRKLYPNNRKNKLAFVYDKGLINFIQLDGSFLCEWGTYKLPDEITWQFIDELEECTQCDEKALQLLKDLKELYR